MERKSFIAGVLGVSAIIGGGVLTRPDNYLMTASDYKEREATLINYPFTYEAVRYLDSIPFFDRHLDTNGGGKAFHNTFPFGNYVEVYDNQQEAILHELSHAWFNHLDDQDKQWGDAFIQAALKVADKDKELGYYWTLKHGNPGTTWHGIDPTDETEWYASIASFTMGGTINPVPDELKPFYKTEFRIK